ncbi:serine/threonine protein kinase [Streptomyces sp. NPDC054847]
MTGIDDGVRLLPLSGDDPRRLGRYRLLHRLASGGMGRVYLARGPAQKLVAVKTLLAEGTVSDVDRRRFEREVRLAQRIDSDHTAKVIDADPAAERPWMAIEYIAAPSLAELVSRAGTLPASAVRWVAAGTAHALVALHREEIVHRDVKPQNILLPLNGPRLIDFGISHANDITRTTLTLGTIAFTSPEQARGEPSTTASDVYSLGATLFHLTVGRPPYPEGEDTLRLLVRVQRGELDATGLGKELKPLILPCLAADPAERPSPQDVLELFLAELERRPTSTSGARWLPPRWTSIIRAYEQQGDELRRGGEDTAAPSPAPPDAPTVDQRTRAVPPPDATRVYTQTREARLQRAERARADREARAARTREAGARAAAEARGRQTRGAAAPARAASGRTVPAPAGNPPEANAPGASKGSGLVSFFGRVVLGIIGVVFFFNYIAPALFDNSGSGSGTSGSPSYRYTPPPTPTRTPSAEDRVFAAVRGGDCLSAYNNGGGWSTPLPVRVDCDAGDAYVRVDSVTDSVSDCPRGPGRHLWARFLQADLKSRVLCVSRQFRKGQCFVAERSGDNITDAEVMGIWNCSADKVPKGYNEVLQITGYYKKTSNCREGAYDRNIYWSWDVDDGRSTICVTSA